MADYTRILRTIQFVPNVGLLETKLWCAVVALLLTQKTFSTGCYLFANAFNRRRLSQRHSGQILTCIIKRMKYYTIHCYEVYESGYTHLRTMSQSYTSLDEATKKKDEIIANLLRVYPTVLLNLSSWVTQHDIEEIMKQAPYISAHNFIVEQQKTSQ